MKTIGWAMALLLAAGGAAHAETPPPPALKLWRLDCGTMLDAPLDMFSDTLAYGGATAELTVSCYLIKHGEQYMIWDTGFGTEYIGKAPEEPFRITVQRSLVDQLADLGVTPDQVSIVGISHNHGDHVGQAAYFPKAKLLLGAADLEAMRAGTGWGVEPQRLAPWLAPDSNAEGVTGDKDVFGDGSVTMLAMPGHTEGHHVLLVRLAKMGPVLLSGDQYHFRAQVENRGVPPFNWNRAETLASHDRFERLAKNLNATAIIQHEPGDVAKLPAAPQAAE